jgi:tetratricopeptide (TPR) repeat protein
LTRFGPRPIALFVALLLVGNAGADTPPLGEPWEEGIVAGIVEQDREVRSRTAGALLQEARSRAQRPGDDTTRVVRSYLLARAYGLAGDQDSARQTYAEVVRLAPRCYFAHRDIAMLDALKTPPDHLSAERHLQQAISIHPRYADALRKLAVLLLETGRASEAVPLLQRLATLEPADLGARVHLLQAFVALRRFADAQREVEFLRTRAERDPGFRHLEGTLYLESGDWARAKEVFRALAGENPAIPSPLQAYLKALDMQAKAGRGQDLEEYLWALERLQRIEKDPQRKSQLQSLANDLRRRIAGEAPPAESGATGPPTDEALLRLLAHADEKARGAALRYIYAREEPPSGEVLKAVMSRLGPERETVAAIRQWVLRVLGRFGSFRMVGLVRISLGDPDPAVPPVAVDSLVALARNEDSARAGALLVLGAALGREETTLATAVRYALLDLAAAPAEDPAALGAWWAGPVAGEIKVQALEAFPRLGSPLAEEVVAPYLDDPDGAVSAAAVRALGTIASAGGSGPRGSWLASFPKSAPGSGDGVARAKEWYARRPR